MKMSNAHGLTKKNLLSTFPVGLRKNPSIAALGNMTMEALTKRPAEIGLLSIYPRIEELPGPLLDILAHDFKVDWWDADYGVEEKRRLLKSSWQVHRMLGTKAAVEKAASAVYPYASVQEWFEYGGEPYHFRLNVDLPEDIWTPERHKRLMRQMEYYKNLRSHLDSVTYQLPPVILQNRQALWFAAMKILLGQKNREQMALERLRLVMGMRQRQGQTVRLHVRSGLENREAVALHQLLMRICVNNYGFNPIRLNGTRRLDGTWRLGQGMIPGLALYRVLFLMGIENKGNLSSSSVLRLGGRAKTVNRVTVDSQYRARGSHTKETALERVRITAGASNKFGISAAVTEDTMWRLNGTFRLNGKRRLNAGTTRSEL